MLAYARIISGSSQEMASQLQQIPSALAGKNIPLDDSLSQWDQ